MEDKFSEQLTAYNQTYKEWEDVYSSYAASCGVSSSMLWLLYSIWSHEKPYTQRELCSDWWYSPQTINSSIKNMVKRGWVDLRYSADNKKNKLIHLTPSGEKMINQVIRPLIQAESNAWADLAEDERTELIALTKKHVTLIKTELEKLNKVSSEYSTP